MSGFKCDVCGYERDDYSIVRPYPDGVIRCKMCAHKSAHGRYIPDYEEMTASQDQIRIWLREWNEWYDSL